MLTSLIVLVTSLCAVQSPPGGLPAQDAPPAPAAAPAAPTETPEKVKNFLSEAEKQFYDPQAMGLKNVEFDAAVVLPQIGDVGKVHITWAAGSEPAFLFTRSESAQLPPGVPPEALQQPAEQVGRQLLDALLNRPVSAMTRDAVATMGAAQDGLVKVSIVNAKLAAQGVVEQACFFDDDGLLQKSTMVIDGAAAGAPGTVPASTTYSWKPVAAGSDLLVPDGMVEEVDFGIVGKLTSKTTFVSRAVDDLVLVTAMEQNIALPAGMGNQSQNIEALNLVINGKPVPPAAPAPASAPAPAGG